MALSVVGTATNNRATDGSLSVTLPSLAADDIIYVAVSFGAVGDINIALTTAGYTELAEIYASDVPGWEYNFAVYRKVADGTETTVTYGGHGGNVNAAITMAAIVVRGADTTTPEDATSVTADTSDNIPDCGSITTATANALVIAFGAGWRTGETPTAPAGYGNLASDLATGVYDNSSVVVATKSVSSPGAENPAAFGNISNVARGACAVTIAARPASASVTAALTGTMASSANETSVRVGGGTIVLTLTGDTWVASGATFNAQRQAIIDGIDSAQAEAGGWDAKVKARQGVAGVVRTSDTVVTITLDAQADYQITAQETITATIPAAALTLAGAVVAAPTFTIDTITESSGGARNMLLLGVG